MLRRVVGWLGPPTKGARDRFAADVFMTGRWRRRDALVSHAYFRLAALHWEDLPSGGGYLDPLHAGLDAVRPPQRVLDIGTGAGVSARTVAERFPDAEVTAIDASPAMLRRARRAPTPSRVTYRRARLERLPFADGGFDLVLALNAVVEVNEVRRVLAGHGQVLMVSSFFPWRDEGSDWVQRWRAMGFARVAGEPVGDGMFEVFEPV